MKTGYIRNNLYKFVFQLNIGYLDEFNARLKQDDIDPISYAALVMYPGKRYGRFFIPEDADLGVIAHESVHGALFIFEEIGQTVDVKSNETVAYLTEWFANKINDRLIKYRKENETNKK